MAAGAFLGPDFAREQFLAQVAGLMGDRTAAIVDTMIDAALESDKGGWAGATSAVTLLIGATGVLVELRNALDAIHRTQPAGGFSAMVRARLRALALILAIGFLLLVSLIASSIIAAVGAWLIDRYPVLAVVTLLLNWTLSLAILAALFGLLMRWLPSQRQSWSSVWPGAIAAAVLMTIGKELLGLYLGRAAFSDAFGAAGSLVVLVMWIYYSVQVFLFGAAFNEVRTEARRPQMRDRLDTRRAASGSRHRAPRREDAAPRFGGSRCTGLRGHFAVEPLVLANALLTQRVACGLDRAFFVVLFRPGRAVAAEVPDGIARQAPVNHARSTAMRRAADGRVLTCIAVCRSNLKLTALLGVLPAGR